MFQTTESRHPVRWKFTQLNYAKNHSSISIGPRNSSTSRERALWKLLSEQVQRHAQEAVSLASLTSYRHREGSWRWRLFPNLSNGSRAHPLHVKQRRMREEVARHTHTHREENHWMGTSNASNFAILWQLRSERSTWKCPRQASKREIQKLASRRNGKRRGCLASWRLEKLAAKARSSLC